MKLPFPENNQTNSYKLVTPNYTTTSTYEPNSVLDVYRTPSPKSHHKPEDALQVDDHVFANQNIDDWDSLMIEFGLNEDYPVSKSIPLLSSNSDTSETHYSPLPDLTPLVSPDFRLISDVSNSFNYVDELIRLADSLDTNSFQLSIAILARLNHYLKSPTGNSVQRTAFYFKEALQSLLNGSNKKTANSAEIVQTIKANNTFSTISPIAMFASLTANQIILEATTGSMSIHVIDFDIGFGNHWASFMIELANRVAPPLLRISALVPDDYVLELRLVRANLTQFARDLNIRLELEFVFFKDFKYLSFNSIKFVEGERVVVLLSPTIFPHVGAGFLNDMRRATPHVVVHVDMEGVLGFGTSSYKQFVIEGLEFYSALSESLEAVGLNSGEWARDVESSVVFPKIVEGMGQRGTTSWRETMVVAGMREVRLSRFTEFQAECLLRRVNVRGFHVAKRQAELLLCWHDRPLVATSAWRY